MHRSALPLLLIAGLFHPGEARALPEEVVVDPLTAAHPVASAPRARVVAPAAPGVTALQAPAEVMVHEPAPLPEPVDRRHQTHFYLGGQVMGYVTTVQRTDYEAGYLGRFGGGLGGFAGVRLNRLLALEANLSGTLHDDGWEDRYQETVRLSTLFMLTVTADAKVFLPTRSLVEPYLQAGVGLALMAATYPDDPRYSSYSNLMAKGVAFNLGGGLDAWIFPFLSLGARLILRGAALGEPAFLQGAEEHRNLILGVTVDAYATIHF